MFDACFLIRRALIYNEFHWVVRMRLFSRAMLHTFMLFLFLGSTFWQEMKSSYHACIFRNKWKKLQNRMTCLRIQINSYCSLLWRKLQWSCSLFIFYKRICMSKREPYSKHRLCQTKVPILIPLLTETIRCSHVTFQTLNLSRFSPCDSLTSLYVSLDKDEGVHWRASRIIFYTHTRTICSFILVIWSWIWKSFQLLN